MAKFRRNYLKKQFPCLGGLAFLLLLLSIPMVGISQEKHLFQFDFQHQSTKEIIETIAEKTSIDFAYSDSEINSKELHSFSISADSTSQLISDLSKWLHIQIDKVGGKYIVKPLQKSIALQVKGTVFAAKDGLPLPGVHVRVLNKSVGTITDSNGNYELTIDPLNNLLHFSCIGFKPVEAEINRDTLLNIPMLESIQTLGETVVIAFGQEPVDLLTGSVDVINPESFSVVNASSINNALQAESAGLLVQSNAGTPGSSMNVTIRGISSITAGTNPLFVVDGLPIITGDYSQLDFSGQTIDAISDISIHDVASISVLKDAAASSLFGARSSNGVILINTRKGETGENQIEFNTSFGLQATTGKLDMLDARQWMTLLNEEAVSAGQSPVYSDEDIQNSQTDTDWLDEVFRVAPTNNMGLSFRGGSEKTKYYLSGNYFNQEGIVIGSDYKRYNLRVNFEHAFNKRFSMEVGNSFTNSINNRVEGDQTLNGPLPNAIAMPPIYPVLNADGSYNNDGPFANPVSIANQEKNLAFVYRNTFNYLIHFQLSNNLTLHSQTGLDYYNLREQTFAPKSTRQGAKYNGLGIEATNNALSFYHSTYLNYTTDYQRNHFDITTGFAFDKYQLHGTFLRAQNFAGTSFEFLQDAATPITTRSNETDAVTNSLFGRLKYNFDNRLLFSFNLRRDGSSKFGKNNRFAFFPAISGMWVMSNESFFKSSQVNLLKISASYGLTGNDQIIDFLSLDLFSAGANYNGEGGIIPSQLANPNLRWESTAQLNLGIDLELRHRFRIQAAYYAKKTKDLLLEKPLPASTGHTYIISNIGKIQNKGLELTLWAKLLDGHFGWDVSFSFATNKNKVLELYQDQPIRNIGRAGSSIEVGEPISFFYGFKSLGVDPQTGLLIFEDINNDGKITDLDRTKIGNPYPDFFGGLTTTLSYGPFSMQVLFSYSIGNDIFNSTRIYTETISQSNQTTAVLDRWQHPGDITDVPNSEVYNKRISSRFVEDGSFVRLKNLRINYLLPGNLIKKAGLKEAQLYLAGKNLITFTPYSGMDPEVNYNGFNAIVRGTDFFTCPQPKSFIIGLCVKI